MLYILLFVVLASSVLSLTFFAAGSIYWACEARNRGFSVKTIQSRSQTSVISINQNYVTFIPEQTDLVDSQLPIVTLVGNSGHIITYSYITQRRKKITRGIKSKVGEVVAGDKVAVDSFVYQHNPSQSLSLEYKEITYKSELGPMSAWHIPAESKKWVIGVHGHRSNMRESLRLVPTFNSLGINVLLINYRNDPNQPEDPQKIHSFGIREWKDLESAVRYIKTYNPDEISLLGHSMGGGIIMKYLLESKTSSEVSKVILESPTLDLNQIIASQAQQLTFMPHIMLLSAKFFLSKMLKISWDEFKYLDRSSELTHPILLIHSEQDSTVPILCSDQLATLRPDIVNYLRLEKGPHAAAWNKNQEITEKTIQMFMKGGHIDDQT